MSESNWSFLLRYSHLLSSRLRCKQWGLIFFISYRPAIETVQIWPHIAGDWPGKADNTLLHGGCIIPDSRFGGVGPGCHPICQARVTSWSRPTMAHWNSSSLRFCRWKGDPEGLIPECKGMHAKKTARLIFTCQRTQGTQQTDELPTLLFFTMPSVVVWFLLWMLIEQFLHTCRSRESVAYSLPRKESLPPSDYACYRVLFAWFQHANRPLGNAIFCTKGPSTPTYQLSIKPGRLPCLSILSSAKCFLSPRNSSLSEW